MSLQWIQMVMPISGLKKKDFQLLVNGKKYEITYFHEYDLEEVEGQEDRNHFYVLTFKSFIKEELVAVKIPKHPCIYRDSFGKKKRD